MLAGRAPFFEPGLEELVQEGVGAGPALRFGLAGGSAGGCRCGADLRGHAFGEERQSGTRSVAPRFAGDRGAPAGTHQAAGRGGAQHGLSREPAKRSCCRRSAVRRWSRSSPIPNSCAKARPFAISWSPRCWWWAATIARSRPAGGGDLFRPAGGAFDRGAAHSGDDQVRVQRVPRGEDLLRQRDRRAGGANWASMARR